MLSICFILLLISILTPSYGQVTCASGWVQYGGKCYLSCPAYSASGTNDARMNYSMCSISACSGDTVLMTTHSPGSCNGDTLLRLYDPSTDYQLAWNDDVNGQCSEIVYKFANSCQTYELREGCNAGKSCGGQIYYSGSTDAP